MKADILWTVYILTVTNSLHLVQSAVKSDKFRTFLLNIEDITQLNKNLREDLLQINETNKELVNDNRMLKADNKALNESLQSLKADNIELKGLVTDMNQTISDLPLGSTGNRFS